MGAQGSVRTRMSYIDARSATTYNKTDSNVAGFSEHNVQLS